MKLLVIFPAKILSGGLMVLENTGYGFFKVIFVTYLQ